MNQPVKLDVIIVIGADRGRALKMLDALGKQSAIDAIRVALVDMANVNCTPVEPVAAFPVSVVPATGSLSWNEAIAAGIRAGDAPFVALIEDHCIPTRAWAEAVIEAHSKGYDAVGFSFVNGSPDTWIYRSIFMAEYGFWASPVARGTVADLPGNNLSVRRDLLAAQLGESVSNGGIDIGPLMGAGTKATVASRAEVAHQSASLPAVLHGHYSLARLSASDRYRRTSLPLRLAVAAAAPLVFPVLRTWRLLRSIPGRPGMLRRFLAALPIVSLVYVLAGLGITAGCLFGAGMSRESFERAQLDAARNIRERQ